MRPDEPARPCRNKPGFLQPGEFTNWHQLPDTIAAQEMCGHCPFRRTCAADALAAPHTPDGIMQAGVICRGDHNTRRALERIAGTTPRVAPVIPLDLARTGTHCRVCRLRLVKQTATPGAGQARRGGRGLCKACHKSATRRGEIEARQPHPDQCNDCHRPMVARHNTPPTGHVEHWSHGLCVTCDRARRYAEDTAA